MNNYELTFRMIKTVTSADRIYLRAHGFVFQNMGDRDAYVNGFTIQAGSTFQIAAPDREGIIELDATITFASGAGSTLLEIGEFTVDLPVFTNYEDR